MRNDSQRPGCFLYDPGSPLAIMKDNLFPRRRVTGLAFPLILRGERTLLLDTAHTDASLLKPLLLRFAELIASPGRLNKYSLSACALWAAAANGMTSDEVLRMLVCYTGQSVPPAVRTLLEREMGRYGKIRLQLRGKRLILTVEDSAWLQRFMLEPELAGLLVPLAACEAEVSPDGRGELKQALTRMGYPVVDEAGVHSGEALAVQLLSSSNSRKLRPYQEEAVEAFCGSRHQHDGSGVVVLPCGSGKTAVGIAAMSRLGCATLILTANGESVRQWQRELLAWTDLAPEQVGEYSGSCKQVRPVTVATYQILTHRKKANEPFVHMDLFQRRDWGLIIYDEVHLLPAPVFRATADIQATRRLGLTATLVREDGCEEDVFSLVGPKRYELPWRELESDGHIAAVTAAELRVLLPGSEVQKYERAAPRARFRLAAENPDKLALLERLLERHKGRPTLIIGHYLSQLRLAGRRTGAPVITGATPQVERERLYRLFREGAVNRLVVSKVANFAVDLPQAEVAIELSGSYGSRQEEAQRVGRIMRPKPDGRGVFFYTMVSKNTVEEEYARNRQLFLLAQGYPYRVEEADLLVEEGNRP